MIKKIKKLLSYYTVTQLIMIKLWSYWKKIYIKITTFYAKVLLILWGAQIGKNLKVDGFIKVRSFGKISIGDNVIINSGPIYVGGSVKRTLLRTEPGGELIMRDNSGITNTAIHCFCKIIIAENVLIGGGSELLDTAVHQTNSSDRINNTDNIPTSPIIIEKNVFVGGNSFIKNGVTIGEGSVIATGSIVTKNIPPNEIWGGVPAKFIRKI